MGNEFANKFEMCKYHGVWESTYEDRKNKGYSLQLCLYEGNIREPVKDHLGNEFPNVSEMCKHYGIIDTTYAGRKRKDLSTEEALGVMPLIVSATRNLTVDDYLTIVSSISAEGIR